MLLFHIVRTGISNIDKVLILALVQILGIVIIVDWWGYSHLRDVKPIVQIILKLFLGLRKYLQFTNNNWYRNIFKYLEGIKQFLIFHLLLAYYFLTQKSGFSIAACLHKYSKIKITWTSFPYSFCVFHLELRYGLAPNLY